MAEPRVHRPDDCEAELRRLRALLFSELLGVFQLRRSWKVALVGLPPALLLAYGLSSPLFLIIVETWLG